MSSQRSNSKSYRKRKKVVSDSDQGVTDRGKVIPDREGDELELIPRDIMSGVTAFSPFDPVRVNEEDMVQVGPGRMGGQVVA